MAFGSSLTATGVCIAGTESDAVIFITNDSDHVVSNNAIESMDSLICQDSGLNGGGGRLALETIESDCFGGGGCEVDCYPFAEWFTCAEII